MLQIVADDEIEAGRVVAERYRLSHVVGEGGMGVVWAATHLITEKQCALKFLKGARASDPRSQARLIHEARAACRVRHPNVAPVHDVLELPSGVPFIVMDLLDGEPLTGRLQARGRLPASEALRIILQVVHAVAAAHVLGVVHRDLKPDNVFLEVGALGEPTVRVLDFGIAKRLDRSQDVPPADQTRQRIPTHNLTTTFSVLGTPSYMAPEQLASSSTSGPAADVWAIGILLFECVTGRRPERDAGGLVDAASVRTALTSPELALPDRIVALNVRMLAGPPDQRPSLEETRLELSRSVDGAPTSRRGAFAIGAAVVASLAVVAFAATQHTSDSSDRQRASPDATRAPDQPAATVFVPTTSPSSGGERTRPAETPRPATSPAPKRPAPAKPPHRTLPAPAATTVLAPTAAPLPTHTSDDPVPTRERR